MADAASGDGHVPRFSFRAKGGDVSGERWIHDGDDPIARFDYRQIQQPEQELRYFNAVPRPINLCDLVLRPGGRPQFAGVQLYWILQSRVLATTELIDVDTIGQDTEQLQLTFVSRDPGGVAESRRVLTLTYDPSLGSYVYDFACHLELRSPEFLDAPDQITMEYSDPWYCDVPAPLVEFPGMWPKRTHTHLVSEEADGTVKKMPLNHVGMRAVGQARVKPDGLFLLAYDEGHNPAMQFPADTAIGVCYWGYDVHLDLTLTREQLRQPICPRFRVFNCPDDRARELLASARPVPQITIDGMTELPLYERRTSFEKGVVLNEPAPGDRTDAWPWIPIAEDPIGPSPSLRAKSPWEWRPESHGLTWEKGFGRTDNYSLKIDKQTQGPAEWQMPYDGQGGFGEPWTDRFHVRVTGHVKAESLTGLGSCIALRWGVYNSPERYPYVRSPRVTGTADWTRVTVELQGQRPADSNAVYIILRQDGPGTTWFDDLEVEFL